MAPIASAVSAARRELELQWARDEQRTVELTQLEQYARDPIGFLNSGAVVIASGVGTAGGARIRPVRLALYPAQEATIRAWIDLPLLAAMGQLRFLNMAAEKSRQIGETWAFAAVMMWALHLHSVSLLAMHTVGREIDDGGSRNTVRSLFGKIRFMDERLDRQALPGLGRLVFRPFSKDPAKVENPANGAVVFGEGQTDNPGRGGTFDGGLVDEAAFVEHGEAVFSAISVAIPEGLALLSTVHGDGNFHARICDARPAGWTYLRLHWSEHPVYSQGLHIAACLDSDGSVLEAGAPGCELCAGTLAGLAWSAEHPVAHRYPGRQASPWYDQAITAKTDEQVANEFDIDRERALGGRVYREFSRAVHVVEAGLQWDPYLPTELAFDYGLDTAAVLVCQDHPAEYRVLGLLEMGDNHGTTATPDEMAPVLRRYLAQLGVPERDAMAPDGWWTRTLFAIGDAAGHSRQTATGRTDAGEWRRQGFLIGKPPTRLVSRVEPNIRAVKRLLLARPKPLRVCGVNADTFARHMANNTWPTDTTGYRRPGSTTPNDDEHNHACRAFAYLICTKFPPPGEGVVRDDSPISPQERQQLDGRIDAGIRFDMAL